MEDYQRPADQELSQPQANINSAGDPSINNNNAGFNKPENFTDPKKYRKYLWISIVLYVLIFVLGFTNRYVPIIPTYEGIFVLFVWPIAIVSVGFFFFYLLRRAGKVKAIILSLVIGIPLVFASTYVFLGGFMAQGYIHDYLMKNSDQKRGAEFEKEMSGIAEKINEAFPSPEIVESNLFKYSLNGLKRKYILLDSENKVTEIPGLDDYEIKLSDDHKFLAALNKSEIRVYDLLGNSYWKKAIDWKLGTDSDILPGKFSDDGKTFVTYTVTSVNNYENFSINYTDFYNQGMKFVSISVQDGKTEVLGYDKAKQLAKTYWPGLNCDLPDRIARGAYSAYTGECEEFEGNTFDLSPQQKNNWDYYGHATYMSDNFDLDNILGHKDQVKTDADGNFDYFLMRFSDVSTKYRPNANGLFRLNLKTKKIEPFFLPSLNKFADGEVDSFYFSQNGEILLSYNYRNHLEPGTSGPGYVGGDLFVVKDQTHFSKIYSIKGDRPFLFRVGKLINATASASVNASNNSNASPVSNSDAVLKTYSNSQYGFSFQYPKELILNDQSNSSANKFITLSESNDQPYLVDFLINPSEQEKTETWKLPLDQILKAKIDNNSIEGQQKTELDNAVAYEGLDHGAVNQYMVFAKSGENLIEILFGNTNKDTFAEAKSALTDVQKQILSSFKFTD